MSRKNVKYWPDLLFRVQECSVHDSIGDASGLTRLLLLGSSPTCDLAKGTCLCVEFTPPFRTRSKFILRANSSRDGDVDFQRHSPSPNGVRKIGIVPRHQSRTGAKASSVEQLERHAYFFPT